MGCCLSVNSHMVYKWIRGGYSLGLWIGVILASAAAFHMWWSLDRGLDREGAAQGFIRKHAFIRYAVIVAVFAVVMLTGAANPLAAFLGIMGLKAAAYMQPFIHKRRHPDTEGQADASLLSSPPDLSMCGGAHTGSENEEKKEVNLG